MMAECDLIMKGGVTSGVVYPHAIGKIAAQYRLRSIGGTSAGAIAAAFAASAEYHRQENDGSMGGFDQIGEVATELATDMLGLFQPTRATEPLFRLLLATIDPASEGGARAVLRAIFSVFSRRVLVGGLLAVLSIIAGIATGNWALGVLGIVLSVLLSVVLILLALKRMMLVDLPAQDFGLCSGKTQHGTQLAFGDWIAAKIDAIAGKTDGPLTVRDLRKHGIEVAAMTTDLSSKRPYRLPMETSIHFFSKAEFERLFPAPIVAYMCETGGRREPRESDPASLPRDLYQLPFGDDFPVYLVARMSLSFPGLISGVPLWRIDYSVSQNAFRRCLFSDGGISSNFPIHFFDSFLPSRPTFGIALGSYDPATHKDRIDLPDSAHQSTSMRITPVTSLPGFLGAILNTAKDWQDAMQSLLPGYAERIVTVRLDDQREGGLNLSMQPDTIELLTELGGDAGARLLSDFKMDDQKLHRALSLFPTLEKALADMSQAYDADYENLLKTYKVKPKDAAWRADPFASFAAALSTIGADAQARHDDPAQKSVRQGDVPHTDAEMRLMAIADRVPKRAEGQTGGV